MSKHNDGPGLRRPSEYLDEVILLFELEAGLEEMGFKNAGEILERAGILGHEIMRRRSPEEQGAA